MGIKAKKRQEKRKHEKEQDLERAGEKVIAVLDLFMDQSQLANVYVIHAVL